MTPPEAPSPPPAAIDDAAARFHLDALLGALETGVLMLDRNRRVLFCNAAYRRLWGLPETEALAGEPEAALLARTAWLREDDLAYRDHLTARDGDPGGRDPFEIRLRNGSLLSETSHAVAGVGGAPIGCLRLLDDVTERHAAQARVVELAERDPLTGLYNGRRFGLELERLVVDAARRGTQVGVMLFDLDGFRRVNERYGHQAGDEVLIRLAQDVGATVRRNEQFFRVGGDEFALIVPGVHETELTGLAKRVLAHVDALSFDFSGESLRVSASLGIALFPEHALNAEELRQCATLALHEVKAGGRHGWGFFDPYRVTRL